MNLDDQLITQAEQRECYECRHPRKVVCSCPFEVDVCDHQVPVHCYDPEKNPCEWLRTPTEECAMENKLSDKPIQSVDERETRHVKDTEDRYRKLGSRSQRRN